MGSCKSKYEHLNICTIPWCNSNFPVRYVLEYEGRHPRHQELRHWLYSKTDNVYTYHACQFCILRCPCANQFVSKL